MAKSIKSSLTELFKAMGGDVAELADNKVISDVIDDLAKIVVTAEPKVIVLPVDASETLYNTSVADIQSDINVINNVIVGNSKFLSGGDIAGYWGDGNFIALKFVITDPDVVFSDIKVGLNPSEGSGLVTLDSDLMGVFKITDKTAQKFKVVVDKDGVEYVTEYNLVGIACATE
jgi:hypothetical protein